MIYRAKPKTKHVVDYLNETFDLNITTLMKGVPRDNDECAIANTLKANGFTDVHVEMNRIFVHGVCYPTNREVYEWISAFDVGRFKQFRETRHEEILRYYAGYNQ